MGATIIEPIPRRIPYVSISRYARDFEIAGEGFETFILLIRAIDDEYITIMAERSQQRWRAMQPK